jgi:hypothetical protein
MTTEIFSSSDALIIRWNGQRRSVAKSHVKEVSIVRGSVIKIDMGLGALKCIYIDSDAVTIPKHSGPENLRDQILSMLSTPAPAVFQSMNEQLLQLNTEAMLINAKLFFQPVKVDTKTKNVTYRGYSLPGLTDPSKAYWAIEIVKVVGNETTSLWAEGKPSFDKIWNNRATYSYYILF